jgi:GT2 family glycosyltransferase
MTVLGVMPVYVTGERTTLLTLRAAESYLNTTYPHDAFLLLIDDGSPYRQGITYLHKKLDGQLSGFFHQDNLGFAKTVNVGLDEARHYGNDALLVNADMEFTNDHWLDLMLDTDADIVGAKLLYPNHNLVQHSGIYYSFYTRLFSHIGRFAPPETPELNVERECPVTGALMLIRHRVLETIGLLDENFEFGFEDVSYCLDAIQAGFKVVYQPKAVAIHHESAFRGAQPAPHIKARMDRSWNYFQEKHAGLDIASLVPTLIN